MLKERLIIKKRIKEREDKIYILKEESLNISLIVLFFIKWVAKRTIEEMNIPYSINDLPLSNKAVWKTIKKLCTKSENEKLISPALIAALLKNRLCPITSRKKIKIKKEIRGDRLAIIF